MVGVFRFGSAKENMGWRKKSHSYIAICAQFAFRSWASMYKAVGCHIYAELLKTFLGDKVRKNKV